jgi:hypothetical protein
MQVARWFRLQKTYAAESTGEAFGTDCRVRIANGGILHDRSFSFGHLSLILPFLNPISARVPEGIQIMRTE